MKTTKGTIFCIVLTITMMSCTKKSGSGSSHPQEDEARILNKPDDGYRGVWYSNQPSNDKYVYKYSGGLGTYPSNHYPFAVYAPEVDKTFFCYGGTDAAGQTLYHEVSYFDHNTGEVPRPVIVLDKKTDDAHDNPVIQVDKEGYIWLFSTSHGTARPSLISRSVRPYTITRFEPVDATKREEGKEVPLDNFSYLQVYYSDQQGFLGLFTHYERQNLAYGPKTSRVIAYMRSSDGVHWSEWRDLANIEEGHYQTSGQRDGRVGTSFNYHPNLKEARGLNYRTNLYYLNTDDFGKTWRTAQGDSVALPLKEVNNKALVHDYASEGLNVYINDLNFDMQGHPVILYVTSKGYEAGPENDPRQWNTARWTGEDWEILPVTTSDNNYDMGSLYIEQDGTWRIMGPTETGPQPYNTGGEIALWESRDQGRNWVKVKQMTTDSRFNHSYVRRPVHAHSDFYALWADGHGRKPSKSRIYFADQAGRVYRLPEKMNQQKVKPPRIPVKSEMVD